GSSQGFTGSARHRGDFGGDDRGGVRQHRSLRYAAAVNGVQRRGSQRRLQWQAKATREHYQDRQRTSETHRCRSVMEFYRHRPAIGPRLRKRQEGVPEPIKEIAWKAQVRLSKRYARLAAAGKDQRKIITAVGRELLGFIWAIGVKVEAASKQPMAA